MANYLTQRDVDNFGSELLDVAIRSAQHALSPELERLHEENEQLHNEVSRATKLAIDRELDAAVPNWRSINADPRFHSWLLMPDTLSGIIRDRLLKDAAHAGSAQRVINFFRGFLREHGQALSASASAGSAVQQRAAHGPVYTRGQITQMATMRRKGQIGDKEWARWEHELIAAGREGRIAGALNNDGIPISR